MNYRLLDSDTVSALLRREPAVCARAADLLSQRTRFALSVITIYEIRRGVMLVGAAAQQSRFRNFCEMCQTIPLTDRVCDKAAEVYVSLSRSGQLIGDADILIAATALARGMILVTNNERHFNRIDGLQIENWVQ